MLPSRHPDNRPLLITEAPVNVDDEFDHRRKRYLVMMSLRAVCIVGAATTFQISGWLAAAFVVAAAVLPWAAVLIANDRPPKKELRFRRFVGSAEARRELLPSDADSDDATAPPRSGAQRDGSASAARPAEPTIIDI